MVVSGGGKYAKEALWDCSDVSLFFFATKTVVRLKPVIGAKRLINPSDQPRYLQLKARRRRRV